jgi:hypothetical protein
MGNNKQIDIEPISPNSFAGLDKEINKSKTATQQEPIGQPTRISVDAYPDLAEMIKDYSYYSGMTQKEAIVYILEQYFKENRPKQRPQEVRERADKRIDRRRKKYRI